jgi:Protein of unknown function (DUF1648)
MTTRNYRLLNAVLLLGLIAGSAWAYPRLPARIPTHFDPSGRPDAWEARSPGSWFFLPLMAAAVAAMLYAVSLYAESHPETWNLPDKRRFLALDAFAQAPIVVRMQAFVAQVGVVVTALLAALQAGIYQAATGDARGLDLWVLGAIGAALLVLAIAAIATITSVQRMIREAERRAAVS